MNMSQPESAPPTIDPNVSTKNWEEFGGQIYSMERMKYIRVGQRHEPNVG